MPITTGLWHLRYAGGSHVYRSLSDGTRRVSDGSKRLRGMIFHSTSSHLAVRSINARVSDLLRHLLVPTDSAFQPVELDLM